MSIDQRQHTRFSLDVPAILFGKFGEQHVTTLQQISVGGCLTGWEENVYPGDEFRLEIELPNRNRLPLKCKAVYRFTGVGIGVRFLDITQFEQELVAKIIETRMNDVGLPLPFDPFTQPKPPAAPQSANIPEFKLKHEAMLEDVMSGKSE
jgi:hypothetical protein